MKNYMLLFITTFIICISSCSRAQNNNSDTQIIETLKDFYSKYNDFWTIKPPLAPDVLINKLDSLNAKFCTSTLRKEAKKSLENENGRDLLTNNLVSVDLNENLKIEKDSLNRYIYIVSFEATNSDASGKPVKQQVVLRVSVVKEGDGYKISQVK